MSQYATVEQFYVHGIRAEALPERISADEIKANLVAASGFADSCLGSHFTVPLLKWGVDLTQAVCAIAAYDLVSQLLIFQPDAAANVVMADRKAAAVRWLERVSDGKAKPIETTETEPASIGRPRVLSKRSRGWVRDCDE